MNLSSIKLCNWSHDPEEWLEKWYNTQLIFYVFQKGNNPITSLFNKNGLNVMALNNKWYYEEPYTSEWDRDKKKASTNGEDMVLRINEKCKYYLEAAEKDIVSLKSIKVIDGNILKQIKTSMTYLWYVFVADLGAYLLPEIDKRLKKYKLSEAEIEQLKDHYILPTKKFLSDTEQKEFKKIVEKYNLLYDSNVDVGFNELDRNFYQMLILHWEKYRFLPYTELDTQPYTVQELLDKVKDYVLFERKEEVKKLDDTIYNLISKEDKNYFKLIQQFTYQDNYANDLYIELDGILADLIHDCTKVSYQDLTWYTFDEIENLLKTNILLTSEEIEERRQHRVMVYADQKMYVNYTNQVFDELENLVYKEPVKTTEFEGMIASRGKVQGTVKIVKGVKDLDKVQIGDILVSPSTRPELVIAMQKCAAIVTDHGGITSHAAIISREFGIPCIVGTHVATQVLKDGDTVEVDATTGKVIKLQ